jgi:hypothetical protein
MKHDTTGRHFSTDAADLMGAARAAIELGAEINRQGIWQWQESIGLRWSRPYSDTVAALADYLRVWDQVEGSDYCSHPH